MNVLRATFPLLEIKLAPSEVEGEMKFSGHGAVFKNRDTYDDAIEPGAFASFLHDAKKGKQPWPAMLSQHGGFGLTAEDMTPIGVWDSLAEDGVGLVVEGKLAPTQRGIEMHKLMGMKPRAAIDGLSIGYIVKESVPRTKAEEPRRTIKRADLIEISPVTFPANSKARVHEVRSIDEMCTLAELEDYLRDAGGFSRGEAKAIIAKAKAATPREADGLEVDELSAVIAQYSDRF